MGLPPQFLNERLQLPLHGLRRGGQAQKLPRQLIHHIFRRVDLLEIEPKYPPLQSAGAAQPVEKAPGQGGLAAAGLAVDQEGRLGLVLHGPLQLLKLPVAPNEAVVPQIRLLGQSRSPFLPLAIRLEAGEAGIALRHLPVQHRNDPVLEGELPCDAASLRLPVHLLSPGPHGLGDAAFLKQLPVKRRNELLGGAHIQAVAHGHHAVNPCPQQASCHTGKGVPGLPVHHPGLAGVQHHAGNPALGQQLGQAGRLNGLQPALLILKGQPALRCGIAARPRGRIAVAPMAVKVNDVVISGAFPQHLPQPVKGGRAQNVHGHRQVLFLNAAHQALRQGPVAHVPRTIGTGNHIEDAEGVLGQALRQRRRVPQIGGKLPLYGKAQGQVAVLPAVQGLPGPGHDLRRIAGDLNPEVPETLPSGSLIPALGLAHEEPVKDRPAPGLQRLRHRLGRLPVGAEGRLQVPLQVPAKPRKKPPLRAVPHRKGDRRRKGDRSRALQIPAAHYGKQRGSILIAYMANLQFHPNNLLGCGRPLT